MSLEGEITSILGTVNSFWNLIKSLTSPMKSHWLPMGQSYRKCVTNLIDLNDSYDTKMTLMTLEVT